MRGNPWHALRLASRLAVLAAALAARAASAQAVAAQLEFGYASGTTMTTDETGRTTRTGNTLWLQRYRLSLDQQLFPAVKLSAGGFLDWTIGSARTEGVHTESDDKKWVAYGRLTFGQPALSGALGYDRNQENTEVRTNGQASAAPTLVRESFSASGSWKPADLPTLDLRLGRTNTYDGERAFEDLTVDEALLGSRFQPRPNVDLAYGLRYSDSADHLHGVDTKDLLNSLLATWSDTFADRRGAVYLTYNGAARSSDTTVTKAGGTVATQQLPIGGWSIVEPFTALPTKVTLNRNDALIDGNTNASAGLNIGFGPTEASDIAYRDLGAQFPNAITPVNTIYVWVNQRLPATVSALFTWDVYQSDDNQNWTLLRASAPATFSPFQSRFEIAFTAGQAAARYLKVVTKPLPASVATDPTLPDPRQFAEVFVTEVQFFQVVDAALARGSTFKLSGNLSGTGKYQITRTPGLAYDVSFFLSHSNAPARVAWSVVNGVGLARRLSRVFTLSARLERSDSDAGAGHDAVNRWSASVASEPIPTLGFALSYSGQLSQLRTGTVIANTAGLLGRADLYTGVSLSANVTGSVQRNEIGQDTRGVTATGSATFVPNRILTLSGSFAWSDSVTTGGGREESVDRRSLLQAAASFTPFPAVALSGGITRTTILGRASTLANFAGSFSPFPGGDLQLRYAYTETLDTSSDTRTRSHGPGARWNIRAGWFLDVSYGLADTFAPVASSSSRTLFANLLVTLR